MMNDEFDYWFFYLLEKNEDGLIINQSLYAYTPDKKLAKEFKKYRNMDMFYVMKKSLHKNEVNSLAREYQNLILKRHQLETVDRKTGYELTSELVMSKEEILCVCNKANSLILKDIYIHCWNSPYLFNKEIFKALKVLQYVSIHDVIENEVVDVPFYHYDQSSIKPDELSIFLRLFGKTIKE